MKPVCLVGESDPFLSRLLRRFAEQVGLSVITAQTGDEVVDIVGHNNVRIVILDPDLPGKKRGAAAAYSLQTLDQDLTLIACTWDIASIESSGDTNYSDYIDKNNIHYEDFMNLIEKYI